MEDVGPKFIISFSNWRPSSSSGFKTHNYNNMGLELTTSLIYNIRLKLHKWTWILESDVWLSQKG